MSDAYCPNWKYNNVIVGYLMKIHAAVETVNLLSLPIDMEEKLKKESILKTVHYSTKIEGNTLNLEEVHEAIENGAGKWVDRKDAREVRNYYDALLFNPLALLFNKQRVMLNKHRVMFNKHVLMLNKHVLMLARRVPIRRFLSRG